MWPPAEKRFLVTNWVAIICLFAVISAGGIVRSTGSGMGCPDWPTCFGQIVPPTDSSQLPEGYERIYVEGRQAKNERFASTMEKLGYRELADRIRHDESILEHEEFNAAKTWTEYVNRLVGATTGIVLLLCAIFSLTFFKNKPIITVLSIVNVFAVGFQAWLGSIVVSTNLMPGMITAHMLLAVLILGISIYTYFKARSLRDKGLLVYHRSGWIKWLAFASLVVIVVQIAIGTDVREGVDLLASSALPRGEWLETIGQEFYLHRGLSYLSFGLVLVLLFLVRSRFASATVQSRYTNILVLLFVLQLVTGIVLSYFAIPPFAQTAHLIIACLIFGAQYYLMLLLGKPVAQF